MTPIWLVTPIWLDPNLASGIVRISSDGASAEQFVAGNNVVGLCFTRKGEMIVATNDSVYLIPCGIHGTLLNS